MGVPTTGTPMQGVFGKLWFAAALPFDASTALCIEFQGEGLHGRASEGYSLLFSVLFRPTLMLLGLFLLVAIACYWIAARSIAGEIAAVEAPPAL